MNMHWKLGIGDPTLMGWFTVAAYFTAGALCAAAAISADTSSYEAQSERQFWLFAFLFFMFLGINKQLDLQSLLTELGRLVAKSEGWYDQRRRYQTAFVGGIGTLCVSTLALFLWRMRSSSPHLKLALLGITFTCTFLIMRAASFHHVDIWLRNSILGLRWNWVIELTGIVTVAAAASRYSCQGWRRRRSKPRK